MKNVLVHITPDKNLIETDRRLIEVQIDNSLKYWSPQDILLATNYPFDYQGIKATILPDNTFNGHPETHKLDALIYLLQNQLLSEISWYHDLCAFQLAPLDPPPLDRDVYLTNYTYKPQLNLGSFIFNPSATTVFQWIKDAILHYQSNEEHALKKLFRKNDHNIHSHLRLLSATYNIPEHNLDLVLAYALRPWRVIHFNPFRLATLETLHQKGLLPESLFKLLEDKFVPSPFPCHRQSSFDCYNYSAFATLQPGQTLLQTPCRSPLAVVDAIKPYIKDKIVCELGSACGDISLEMAKYAKSVFGVEVDTERALISQKRGVETIHADLRHLPEIPPADVYYLWVNHEIIKTVLAKIKKGVIVLAAMFDDSLRVQKEIQLANPGSQPLTVNYNEGSGPRQSGTFSLLIIKKGFESILLFITTTYMKSFLDLLPDFALAIG